MYYIQLHIDTNIQNIYIYLCTFKYLDISHIYYTYYIILFYLCNTYINIWCLFSRVPTPFSPTVLWSSVAELSLPSSLRDLNQDIFPHRQYFQHQRWEMALLAKLMVCPANAVRATWSRPGRLWSMVASSAVMELSVGLSCKPLPLSEF